MQKTLQRYIEKNRAIAAQGEVADYIPELRKASVNTLGATVATADGDVVSAGDCSTQLTMQSVSKVMTLILALMDLGEEAVFSRVGMEPTGDPFNSIYKLEVRREAKPLNPMINAGAIAVSSMIVGKSVEDRLERIMDLVRVMSGNPDISYSREVYESEAAYGDRNRALAYFLKEHGMIEDVEEVLDLYFRQCAIVVTCEDLAKIGLCLAQFGKNAEGRQVVPPDIARLVKTFMVTCGMYDESGEFAIRVGIPAKSGVSGAIMASVPNRMGIGVVGPALNKRGNSIAGVKLLEDIAREWELSIF